MSDEALNPSTRAELLRLAPTGDLLHLARDMRDMGVESLLFCAPSGRIRQVVTDREIAHLAANPVPVTAAVPAPPAELPDVEPLFGTAPAGPVIPSQTAPARAESVSPVDTATAVRR